MNAPNIIRFASTVSLILVAPSLAIGDQVPNPTVTAAARPFNASFSAANLFDTANAEFIDAHGVQIAPLHYPHLTHTEIFNSVETFYKRFYFRDPKIAAICGEMVRDRQMLVRRLREGVEFFQFLRERSTASAAQKAAA